MPVQPSCFSPIHEILTPLYNTCHANLIEDVAPHSCCIVKAGNFIHNGGSTETMCCKVHVIGVESNCSPSRPLHRPTLVCEQCIGLHSTGDHNCLESVGLCTNKQESNSMALHDMCICKTLTILCVILTHYNR